MVRRSVATENLLCNIGDVDLLLKGGHNMRVYVINQIMINKEEGGDPD
jgi:hypothetical protein